MPLSFPGGAGTETPKATNATSGTVKTDILNADPIVYLKDSVDTLLAGMSSSGGRLVLTANRIYYVRTDGSDLNNGLTNNPSGAFLTIQKAVDVACGLDLSIYSVIIQLADGTYTGQVNFKNMVGGGQITIKGNVSSPQNVVCTVSGVASVNNTSALFEIYSIYGNFTIEDLTVVSTGSGFSAFTVLNPGVILSYRNIVFNSGFSNHFFSTGGKIICTGSYAINSGANNHFYLNSGTYLEMAVGIVLTLNNNPNFGRSFITLNQNCYGLILSFPGFLRFSGTATGKRYELQTLCSIDGVQGNPNYFPGSEPGLVAGNSIYI